MVNNNHIKVLKGCRLILKFTNLYNKNGVCIGSIKIPNFLCFCLIMLPVILLFVVQTWYCFDENFNLNSTSNTLAMVIAGVQMALVYISLSIKSDFISKTVNYLQNIVKKSNLHSHWH